MKKRKCPICKTIFKPEHPNSRYCKPKCRIIARKRQIYINVNKHREKREIIEKQKQERKMEREIRQEAIGEAYKLHGSMMEQYHTGLGTDTIGPHRNEDVELEEKYVKNEIQRLNLNTKTRISN